MQVEHGAEVGLDRLEEQRAQHLRHLADAAAGPCVLHAGRDDLVVVGESDEGRARGLDAVAERLAAQEPHLVAPSRHRSDELEEREDEPVLSGAREEDAGHGTTLHPSDFATPDASRPRSGKRRRVGVDRVSDREHGLRDRTSASAPAERTHSTTSQSSRRGARVTRADVNTSAGRSTRSSSRPRSSRRPWTAS